MAPPKKRRCRMALRYTLTILGWACLSRPAAAARPRIIVRRASNPPWWRQPRSKASPRGPAPVVVPPPPGSSWCSRVTRQTEKGWRRFVMRRAFHASARPLPAFLTHYGKGPNHVAKSSLACGAVARRREPSFAAAEFVRFHFVRPMLAERPHRCRSGLPREHGGIERLVARPPPLPLRRAAHTHGDVPPSVHR